MKVLYIQTAFLGDLLLAIPTLRRIKAVHPESKITLYCRKGLGGLMRSLDLVDDFVETDKKSALSRYDAAEKLNSLKWDLVFCPHESTSSAVVSWRARARKKYGFKKWWNGIVFSSRVEKPQELPEAIRQMSLLRKWDSQVDEWVSGYQGQWSSDAIAITRPAQSTDAHYVPEWASMSLKERLDDWWENGSADSAISNAVEGVKLDREGFHIGDDEPVFVLSPGSVWATKRWTIEGYTNLAKKWSQEGRVILLGAPNEVKLCEQITDKVPDAINLAGSPLLNSIFHMLKADKIATNDCGAMHLASVVELPCVTVFGPTTLDLGYRPWQNRTVVVENKKISCRPCGKHGHQKCPIGTHECMTSISADQVAEAAQGLSKS